MTDYELLLRQEKARIAAERRAHEAKLIAATRDLVEMYEGGRITRRRAFECLRRFGYMAPQIRAILGE